MFDLKLLVSAITLVVIDSMYLNIIKSYFLKQITLVQGTPVKLNFLAILLCYIFLVFGINYFIIKPNRSVQDAFLLGLIIYGVYETTNMALFAKWSWLTVLIDTLWGGILFALTTFIVKMFR
jgi:uncharacterized membrane protein